MYTAQFISFSFIFLSVLPQTVTITPPAEPFSVSRVAVLECRSSGSRPPATITWWKRAKFMGKATEEVSTITLWKKIFVFCKKQDLKDPILAKTCSDLHRLAQMIIALYDITCRVICLLLLMVNFVGK